MTSSDEIISLGLDGVQPLVAFRAQVRDLAIHQGIGNALLGLVRQIRAQTGDLIIPSHERIVTACDINKGGGVIGTKQCSC